MVKVTLDVSDMLDALPESAAVKEKKTNLNEVLERLNISDEQRAELCSAIERLNIAVADHILNAGFNVGLATGESGANYTFTLPNKM